MWDQVESIGYNLHPPLLRALGWKKKLHLGQWFGGPLRMLAAMKSLRGGPLDVFGYAQVRREERELIVWYRRSDGAVPAKADPGKHRIGSRDRVVTGPDPGLRKNQGRQHRARQSDSSREASPNDASQNPGAAMNPTRRDSLKAIAGAASPPPPVPASPSAPTSSTS